ncbi:unnamed protein product [Blepharisma stoltei]|uniref:Uncharacterized protein n=1 Tax=Blepharisma stoltei TaxID=1481888 RepID=A0AAU9IBE9_9CILI|nr:unnamed protein product [Blepharisma stoltei]
MEVPAPKTKNVRIRNRTASPELKSIVNTSTEQPESTSKRTLKVHRKVKEAKDDGMPPPGSIEEDFILEKEGDATNFLKERNSATGEYTLDTFLSGPHYDDNGNLIPYSVVGPSKLFDQNKAPDWESFEAKLPENDKRRMSKHANFNKKAYNLDPEKEFQEKLRRIEEGAKKEETLKKQRMKTMGNGEKIIQARQEKILEAFRNTEYKWRELEKSLGKISNKNEGDLLANRAQEYREKVEEWDFLDRSISSKEKAGDFAWYMSLRDNSKDKLDTYLHVGNIFSGLFSRIAERSDEVEPIIRKPGLPKTLNKTFRDDPYFQKRVQSEESKNNIKPVNCTEIEDLYVVGYAKLPMELEAAKNVGIENVRPNLTEIQEQEEIIAESYDSNYIRNKY